MWADRPGRSVRLLAVPIAVLLLLVTTSPVDARPAPPKSDDEAVDLLTRSTRAASRTAYRGVQQVQAWSGARGCRQTLRVNHVPGRGTEVRALGRRGANVPGSRYHVAADATVQRLGQLTANYDLVRAGVARVVGRLADIVDAKRRTGSVVARYWLDRSTGLLLRRDVFDDDGRLARRSAFTRITVDAPGSGRQGARSIAAAPAAPHGRRVPLQRVTELRADGWTVPRRLADRFTLYQVRKTEARGRTALHLAYSDGVSVLSVFEQHGHLARNGPAGWRAGKVAGRTVYLRDTLPRQLTWAGPDTVFTVVTDAPDRAVGDAVRTLPWAQRRLGIWARIARGLERIASWCNPF